MRIARTVLGCMCVLGVVGITHATGVLTATGDNRSGTVQAYIDHGGDPLEAGYNIVPGENEYDPINYNQTVTDPFGSNSASAMLNTHSSYVGFNSQNHTFTSLSAVSNSSAALHVVNAPSGFARSHDRVSMGFQVSGLSGAQRLYVRVQGSVQHGTGATSSVTLTGPGVNLAFTTGSFNQVVGLQNGSYTFLPESDIPFTSNSPINVSATASFSVTMTPTTAGDLNCDNVVDFNDINPFVLALSGYDGYHAMYPNCNWLNADCNGDAQVNFNDINNFVDIFGG